MMEERNTKRSSGPRQTAMWRMGSLEAPGVLNSWLSAHGLDIPHLEPGIEGGENTLHPGYHVAECLVCHRPTIVGNGRTDVTCGRHTCAVPLLGATHDLQ